MTDRYNILVSLVETMGDLVIAFSGGVDSSFLAAVAVRHAKGRVLAVTAVSEFLALADLDHSIEMARLLGIRQTLVQVPIMQNKSVTENTSFRCYHCKKAMFEKIGEVAAAQGVSLTAHGANCDDLKEFRPGYRAALDLGVVAPLIDSGYDKAGIRQCSKRLGLKTWDMPSQSCLATRIPYGQVLTRETLSMVEAGETLLGTLGFSPVRVRCHQGLARIEVAPGQILDLLRPDLKQIIVSKLIALGFDHVAVDMQGYVSGSMNRSVSGGRHT
ncbi:MAG: ATP-dependent sacrificial sulfur transferase LarE [Pseudomonadota bacterium]